MLAADGDVAVVRTNEGIVDGIIFRHVVCDLCDAPYPVSGAVDVDHTVIADEDHLCRTAPEKKIRVLLDDAIFEDLHGSVTERIGFKPGDFRFGSRPEETADDTAEDSGTGDASAILELLSWLFCGLFRILKLPIFLIVEVVELAGKRIDVFPCVLAIGADKSFGDLLAREVWQGIPIIVCVLRGFGEKGFEFFVGGTLDGIGRTAMASGPAGREMNSRAGKPPAGAESTLSTPLGVKDASDSAVFPPCVRSLYLVCAVHWGIEGKATEVPSCAIHGG